MKLSVCVGGHLLSIYKPLSLIPQGCHPSKEVKAIKPEVDCMGEQ